MRARETREARRVTIYTHVTVELAYGRLAEFLETMPRIVAIVEQSGWKLHEALIQANGRLFTVIHIWKLRDMNHYGEGVALLAAHPDFPELMAAMSAVTQRETIVFAEAAPYSPSASA